MMAEVFSRAGYEVLLLEGGYKAYRRCIRERLGRKARIVVLGGYTGSGKTELLHALAAIGEQVLDLEGLACHKGSVFGAFGQPEQPANEQFENNLYSRWAEFDLTRTVWVEDESRMIGRVTLPDPVVAHVSSGKLVRIVMDLETRIDRLVQEYAGFDSQLLAGAIGKIAERLGSERTSEALNALESGDFKRVAGIVLAWYDKAYHHSVSRRSGIHIGDFRVTGAHVDQDARNLAEFIHKLTDNESDLPRL
jgi:tRNA 2-selenouridine synthase